MTACCDWETFQESLIYVANKKRFPLVLLDWKKARRCWKRYGMSGYEAFITITKEEMNMARDVVNAEFSAKLNRWDGDDGSGTAYCPQPVLT